MRKYQLFAISACAAVALGIGGCAAKTEAAATTEAQKVETTTDVIETVDGTIESMEETQPEALQPVRIYGTVSRDESGRLTIDNQSGQSYSGEIVLNVSDQDTLILDAVDGLPVSAEDIKDGDMIYVYIGQAMTMSLPPQTNAQLIICNIPADFKVPDYVTVDSVVTDAASSKSVLTTTDGATFEIPSDCTILPYLTKNIVTLDDLAQGRTCLIWSDDQGVAQKIVLFAE
ncbi:MAG: hypothetical protein KH230_23750 [Enterocloster asparagiformis]|nr:hypothetical protein [Enterocloster asparagiformis]